MNARLHTPAGLMLVVIVAACSAGDQVAGPSDEATQRVEYPLVQGTYQLSAPFTAPEEMAGARYTGTFSLFQPYRTVGGFDGSYAVQIIGAKGEQSRTFTGTIRGEVATDGAVLLQFYDGTSNDFRWNGKLDQTTIAGTWRIRAPDNSSFSGTFTANRQ
jgi:hypothetical protein